MKSPPYVKGEQRAGGPEGRPKIRLVSVGPGTRSRLIQEGLGETG